MLIASHPVTNSWSYDMQGLPYLERMCGDPVNSLPNNSVELSNILLQHCCCLHVAPLHCLQSEHCGLIDHLVTLLWGKKTGVRGFRSHTRVQPRLTDSHCEFQLAILCVCVVIVSVTCLGTVDPRLDRCIRCRCKVLSSALFVHLYVVCQPQHMCEQGRYICLGEDTANLVQASVCLLPSL